MGYIILFISALLLVNSIPHFVKGVIGEKHMTPFGRPSSPPLNIIWGLLNAVPGFYLLEWTLSMTLVRPLADIAFLVGISLAGIFLSVYFGNDPKARGK